MKVEHESMLDFIVKYIKEKGYPPYHKRNMPRNPIPINRIGEYTSQSDARCRPDKLC